ncbi:MAG: hypothetical protein ABIN55_13550 [Aeromicrobium sp.]
MPNPDSSLAEILFWLSTTGVQIAISVASYRRSRCLSRYPIWRSVLIGLIAGAFAILWLIVWWVNRDRIAEEWRRYREPKAQVRRTLTDSARHRDSSGASGSSA